ncbi:hypothetical protein MNBD_GAMMA08-802 [hydrothermal vent metagenome]|uniref:Histidine phosphatase family protein n=1 Tax=hydrothermal vent metagenome TaxID=652676 RepID=A0A3B0XBW9_9ZZZZ
MRHGKPVLPPLNKISPKLFIGWVDAYNISGLCSASVPTDEALKISTQSCAVVCSALPRSIESAKALGAKNITLISAKFNEAEMPISDWCFPKLSPKIWAVFFRVVWFFGYSKNSETFKEAKLRAKESVAILKEQAKINTTVLFVGHGVYNRLLANELNATGWLGPESPGSKYWSYGVYKPL